MQTGPGEQAQFDWSFTVMLGDVPTKVVVFGLILGYSRRKFYWPSLDATQPSIYEALWRRACATSAVRRCVCWSTTTGPW